MSNFLAELKRRNVLRIAGLYVVGAWLLIQIAETLLPIFRTPDWVLQALVVLLALGFIPALVGSWVFELTPEGLRRDNGSAGLGATAEHTARRLDIAVIALLLLTLAVFAWDRWSPRVPTADAPAVVQEATASSAALGARSIAVLSFENFSADTADAFFADGLADTLLHRLAQLPELTVIARNSSFSYKGSNVDVRRIGAELGVATVLEGSVQRSGQRLRVIAQLIETGGGTHLWSQTYDRALDDIFSIQDDIATAVAVALQGELIGAQARVLTGAGTNDPQALALYLKAMEDRRKAGDGVSRGMPELIRERDLLLQALARDPQYLAAWTSLVRSYTGMIFWTTSSDETRSHLANARAALQRAMQIDPAARSVREAWVWVLYREGKTEQAVSLALGLLEDDPNNVELLRVAGISLWRSMRHQEALDVIERGLQLDPRSISSRRLRASLLIALGRLDEAERIYQDALAQQPDDRLFWVDRWRLQGWILGRWDEAVRMLGARYPGGRPIETAILEGQILQAGMLGLPAQGDALLQRYAAQQPSAMDRTQERVGLLMARGDWPLALAVLRDALPVTDDTWRAEHRHRPALLAWLAGDEREAHTHLAAGVAGIVEPFTGGVVLASHEALKSAAVFGLLAVKLGEQDTGERILRAALAMLRSMPLQGGYPGDAARIYGEAEILAALGEREAALAALEAALPAQGEAVHLLGLADTYIGDSPFLRTLHDEPRYRATIDEIDRRRLRFANLLAPAIDAALASYDATPTAAPR